MIRAALYSSLTLLSGASSLLAAGLQSGPMIGAANLFETVVWLQTTEEAEVQVVYWPEGDRSAAAASAPLQTRAETAFVAKVRVGPLQGGQRYTYELLIDGEVTTPKFRDGYAEAGPVPLSFTTPPLWRYREGGHQPFDFSIGFGSCFYRNDAERRQDRLGGKPYGSGFEIFEAIYERKPDAFVWLGDTIYLREDDWSTQTGIRHRWTHGRSLPELRGLLANVPQYFTWDDHEFGPNDIGSTFWNKAATTEAFELFTANPSYGLPELPGIFTYFNWGDAHFYLLDNRTYRDAADLTAEPYKAKSMLGRAQLDWLVDHIVWADGQGKRGGSYPFSWHIVCVGNQVLSPARSDNLPNYPEDFQYLFDRLMHEGINGVVFVTGDVHFGEVSERSFTGGGDPENGRPGVPGQVYTYFDVTTSPLTAGAWAGTPAEENPYRRDIFPGEADRVGQHNFAVLRFSGETLAERQLAIEFYDREGTLLNQEPGAPAGTVTAASILRAADYRLAPRD